MLSLTHTGKDNVSDWQLVWRHCDCICQHGDIANWNLKIAITDIENYDNYCKVRGRIVIKLIQVLSNYCLLLYYICFFFGFGTFKHYVTDFPAKSQPPFETPRIYMKGPRGFTRVLQINLIILSYAFFIKALSELFYSKIMDYFQVWSVEDHPSQN